MEEDKLNGLSVREDSRTKRGTQMWSCGDKQSYVDSLDELEGKHPMVEKK
jgi:hypothetical protein